MGGIEQKYAVRHAVAHHITKSTAQVNVTYSGGCRQWVGLVTMFAAMSWMHLPLSLYFILPMSCGRTTWKTHFRPWKLRPVARGKRLPDQLTPQSSYRLNVSTSLFPPFSPMPRLVFLPSTAPLFSGPE